MTNPARPAWQLPLRFGLVGLVNTAFGYVVFAGFVLAGVQPGTALVLGTVVSVAFNFQTSRRLVFRKNGRWVRFILIYMVLLGLDWMLLQVARVHGIRELIAQLVLALPLGVLSYGSQRALVFGDDAKKAFKVKP